MLAADGALMNAKQPALQERRNPVHPWHRYMRRIPALRQHGPTMRATDPKNVTPAGCLIRKPAIKLLEIPGLINACHGFGKGVHVPRYYMQGPLASSG